MKKTKTPKANSKITDSTFLDKNGKITKVSDIVSENDCWFVERENRWAMAHRAVKKIADVAGISKTYDVKESENVTPSFRNELEHIVRVTIHCLAKKHKKGCVHNELEKSITMTGESNRVNTPVLGRGYLRKMAEKRAYDLAVLEHLNLHTTTFSEEESEAMLGRRVDDVQSISIMSTDLELMREDINSILLCNTSQELSDLTQSIEKNKADKKYNPIQIAFLEKIYNNKLSDFKVDTPTESTLF